jgi:hypothetical protein
VLEIQNTQYFHGSGPSMKAAKTTVTKLGIKRIPWLELRSQNREKGKNQKRTRCEPQGETSGEAV